MKDEDFEEIPVGRAEDLRGQKFGKLTVLYRTKNKGEDVCWVCQCDCGNKIITRAHSLKTKHTISCGCAYREDLTGQHFGKLTVLKYHHTSKDRHACWICLCECGNEVVVTSNNLKKGNTVSCGCVRSYGETVIAKILQENNILFKREKSFDDCYINNGKARFDFYVDNQYVIEFDGKQHFQSYNTGWNTEENLIEVQQSDAIKNKYCIDNNIPLIRIPYWHRDDIVLEDLLLETTKFLYKEN